MKTKFDRKKKMARNVPAWERNVAAAFAEIAKLIGLMPVVGEVAAAIYFSPVPMSKSMLEKSLCISHGSSQNAIDALRAFGVLTVHKKSLRAAEHYTIEKSLHELAASAIHSLFLPAISGTADLLLKAREQADSIAVPAENLPVPEKPGEHFKPTEKTLAKIDSVLRALAFVREQLEKLDPQK